MGDTVPWEILRCAKEIPQSPVILGSCLRLVGYCKGLVSEKKVLPQEVLKFARREQYQIMKRALHNTLHRCLMRTPTSSDESI